MLWETCFLLEYNCFLMFYKFLLYNEVSQLYVCIYPLFGPTFYLPNTTHLGHHRALSWAPCDLQQVPLTIYFTHTVVSVPIFQFIQPSFPTPCVPMSVLYVWKQVHLYYPSRFHICALICDIFSFWLTSFCLTDSRSILISTNDPLSFLFMAE